MAATIRSLTPYVLGLALLGVAVAGLLPGALSAACGLAGLVLIAVYALQRARSGELGHRHGLGQGPGYGGDGMQPPADGHHQHHGGHGHGGDGGWSGGDFGGGGGHGGGGHGGH
jgi:hypothetical protein